MGNTKSKWYAEVHNENKGKKLRCLGRREQLEHLDSQWHFSADF